MNKIQSCKASTKKEQKSDQLQNDKQTHKNVPVYEQTKTKQEKTHNSRIRTLYIYDIICTY